MSDLIKREDAIKAVWECYKMVAERDIPQNVDLAMVDAIQTTLAFIPSADRPQGEWIEQEACWQCSECGDEFVLEVGVKPIDARMHYCPSCGARMKGADNE